MIAQHCEYAKKFVHIKMMNFMLFESQFKSCSLSKNKNKCSLSHKKLEEIHNFPMSLLTIAL